MISKVKHFLTITVVFILCFLNISKVSALNIDVDDVKVKNKNASAKVGKTTFNGQNIDSKIILHKVGSYIEYELTLDNKENKKYQIKKISNNLKNKNIKISYNSEELKPNDKAKLNIKIKYNKEIKNSIKNKNLKLTLNLKEQDNISLYFICLVSATLGIIFIITTRKHKNLRLIVATLTIIPILILLYWSLSTEKYDVKLDNITVIGYSKKSRASGDGISSFKVNIDPGNGENSIEKIVDYGDKIGELPTPAKEGYEFEGWVDDKGNTVTEDTEVTDEMFIEAKYKTIEYKISYELNGGENNIENPLTYTKVSKDTKLKEPYRSTYIFTGWTGSNGKDIQKEVVIKNGTEGDLNYTAHYTKSVEKLNVILDSETFIYTGEDIRPGVVVKDGNIVLKENVDYTIKYVDNIESGTAKVVVTMTGEFNKNTDSTYEGTTTKEFTINKRTPKVNARNEEFIYTGNPVLVDTKNVTVSPNSKGTITIKYYTDKKLNNEISEVIDSGVYYYQVEVSETKNYTKAYSSAYVLKVNRKTINIPTQKNEVTYNGSEQILMTNQTEYTVSGATKGTNAGSYEVTVTPTSNYAWKNGTTTPKTVTMVISPYNISSANVTPIPNVTYNGLNQTPTPSVNVPLPSVDNPTTLTSSDITYSYSNNKNAGTATVTITGKGNYTGSKTKDFTIDKAQGYISLSETSGNAIYGNNTKTFNITDSHGGDIEVTDNNNIATVSRNNNVITISNLGNIPANTTIVVTVKCKENNNYTSASATYTLNISTATLTGGSVTITGNNAVGEVLTANVNDTTPVATYTYKWFRNNSNSTSGGSEISGATNSTYTLTTQDVGKYIYVEVTASKDNYDGITFSNKTNTSNNISNTTVIKSSVPNANYCKNLTYTGSSQTLTNVAEEGYAFYDNSGIDAGEYTVTAKLKNNYIWNDLTIADKTFKCNINKSDIIVTITPEDYTYDGTYANFDNTITSKLSNNSNFDGNSSTKYYRGSNCDPVLQISTPFEVGEYSVRTTVTGTSNYNDGTSACMPFNIYHRYATCEAYSDTKVYDKTPLTKNGGECTNIAELDTYTIINSGSITNVSESEEENNPINTVTINRGNYDVTNNYLIHNVAGTLTITPKKLESVTNLTVSPDGVVSWTNSEDADGYEISINNGPYMNATNGENYLSEITSTTGERTIKVRAISNSGNYITSDVASKTVNVYKITINSNNTDYGTVNTSTYNVISGATYSTNDNELLIKSGSTILKTITATRKTKYVLDNWSSTSGTINSNLTITATFRLGVSMLKNGHSISVDMKKLANNLEDLSELGQARIDYNIKHFKRSNNLPDNSFTNIKDISYDTSDFPVYIWFDSSDNTIYYYAESDKIYLNENGGFLFYRLESLTDVEISDFDTSKAKSLHSLFDGCKSLESVDVTHFDTSNVTDMSEMFFECNSLRNLDVTHFDTKNVTNMSRMFYGCNNLESLDVAHFDTREVTDMSYMFAVCRSLTELDLTHFNTSKVTNMSSMFSGCSNLENIDVTHFDTKNVTNMNNMFSRCKNLTSLDVTHFNTSKVTNMWGIFGSCEGLTSIDVSNFDTSKVTDMSEMFFNCKNLESIDVSNFDTSNNKDFRSIFYGLEKIKTLDVSNFDTSNVEIFHYMFANCSNLKTIYASDSFVVKDSASTDGIFQNDTNLVGGNGTSCSGAYSGLSQYAVIDTPTTPGYFTAKN